MNATGARKIWGRSVVELGRMREAAAAGDRDAWFEFANGLLNIRELVCLLVAAVADVDGKRLADSLLVDFDAFQRHFLKMPLP